MTPTLAQIDGLWWPADDQAARPVITRDCAPAIAQLVAHIPGRDLIVQAGANVGLYPLALADRFQRVLTAEPDGVNWACLVRNLEARDSLGRIEAHGVAFGASAGVCAPLEVHPHNCGAHRVNFGKGEVPVRTIDSFDLPACDAIWLDIEGAELFALSGAVDTIRRFSPVIACEDKGLDRQFFGVEPGSLQRFLHELGYNQVDQIGRDKIFKRTA